MKPLQQYSLLLLARALLCVADPSSKIDRNAVVSRYNPTRNASSWVTPMQVGNGNFAFGADVTSLQTFLPYATMSSWGWKNDTLPPNRTWEDVLDYEGVSWWNHDRLVTYMFDGEPEVQQWLISNPNRVNLGIVGLLFMSSADDGSDILNVTEADLTNIHQELDLWTGKMTSSFTWQNESITVETYSHQANNTIATTVTSPLIAKGQLGLFLDFPWNDGSEKFEDPFVGWFNMTANHTTEIIDVKNGPPAQINHTMVANSLFTAADGDPFNFTRDSPDAHRYNLRPLDAKSSFSVSVSYDLDPIVNVPSPKVVGHSSVEGWEEYWTSGGFVDMYTGSTDSRADELQRRTILSMYLERVNEAGDYPPQESGLVNNGWYGKFHLEMYFWHSCHWALWNQWSLMHRSTPVYQRFLQTSIERAQVQEHWDIGARWGKMSDPSGRSAPGEINELLIWQQPHPLVFAEYEYRAFSSSPSERAAILNKWREIVVQTADWMADFAWWNDTTGVYDLGPPMYVVAEDTSPNITINPAFELAYWRHGLHLASQWMQRLDEPVPQWWTHVKENLAPLPLQDGLYSVYEGMEEDWWADPAFINDHPALVGLYGWLPQTPGVNLTIANATAAKVHASWNISNCWGWDFPMLAMNSARFGQVDDAIEWLLNPLFTFDDVGMPGSGVRAPTPYFPSAGSLLYAIAMMAEGWEGSNETAPGFPKDGWNVRAEGLMKAM